MGISKHVLKRSNSLQHGKTDCLYLLIIATRRRGVFIWDANGHVGIWFKSLIARKPPMVEVMMSSIMLFWKTARNSVLKLFVSNFFCLYCVYYLCFVQWGRWEVMNKPQLLWYSCVCNFSWREYPESTLCSLFFRLQPSVLLLAEW